MAFVIFLMIILHFLSMDFMNKQLLKFKKLQKKSYRKE